MMTGEFIEPQRVNYASIVPAYQEAFKEDPWNEVSKCVDVALPQRCGGGLSPVALGAACMTCLGAPTRPAYESDELVERFQEIGDTRKAMWYVEQDQTGVAVAALFWEATASQLAAERYSDAPEMRQWLGDTFAERKFVYLDEIFRNRIVRPVGNLANLGAMIEGAAERFALDTVAYRSKQPRLLGKTQQVFGDRATLTMPPDPRERTFVTVSLGDTK